MDNRREFMKSLGTGAAALGAATLLSSVSRGIDNCGVQTEKELDDGTIFERILLRNGLKRRTPCLGNSCAQQGMVGSYPNCYYRQYLSANVTLANNTKGAGLALYNAVKKRTVTQGHVNTAVSYAQQMAAQLSLQQSVVNDGLRMQWLGDSIYLAPGQPEMHTALTNWAYANNQNPVDFTVVYDGTNPNLSQWTPDNQQLTKLVNNLPITMGSQDSLSAWTNTYAASVQVPTTGVVKSTSTAQTLIEWGEDEAALGTLILTFCPDAGPAAPYCAGVAGGMIAFGSAIFLVGKLMQSEEE